jgi:hypothetical protein
VIVISSNEFGDPGFFVWIYFKYISTFLFREQLLRNYLDILSQEIFLISFLKASVLVLLNNLWYGTLVNLVVLLKIFVLNVCTIDKWSEISLKIIPLVLSSSSSRLLVKMLSISVAVWWVICVGLVISRKKDDVRGGSRL